jgi:3-oxoacyl-[acyl-carrier-protein] synthase II
MANVPREAWITGIGIVSCLGEGAEMHWQRLNQTPPRPDIETWAPYAMHRMVALELDKQIPKKGDQRQMEPWQRIGTYAAGLALEDAGVKGKTDLLAHMDMIVAAGGGERDEAVDVAILSGLRKSENPAFYLNERLMNDLRPTLFLAQLSNLLAGNISIVHGVTGSSRTFMGEEAAGIDALRIAVSRIAAGQSDIMLVGGAHNGERKDLLVLYEFGGYNLKDQFAPVWERGPKGGFALGSLGAFLVLESPEHAKARGAKPIAQLSAVLSDRTNRQPGAAAASLRRMRDSLAGKLQAGHHAVISGATGVEPATSEERTFLSGHPEVPVRAPGSYVGHGMEAQFPMNVALAAMAVSRGSLFPPAAGSRFEQPMQDRLTQAIVTGVGHWRGEGLALVEAAG